MEPQFFAMVDADDHDIVYCFGVDTGDGAFTFRRDPRTCKSIFGSSASMYSAFTRASQIVRDYGRLELVTYDSAVDEVLAYREGLCLACDNERTISFGPDGTIPCPECTDEYGNIRSSVR